MKRPVISHPCTDAASAGGDLEVPIQVLNGSTGEEAFHHQKNTIDEECWGNAIDHILDDVNAVGEKWSQRFVVCMGHF